MGGRDIDLLDWSTWKFQLTMRLLNLFSGPRGLTLLPFVDLPLCLVTSSEYATSTLGSLSRSCPASQLSASLRHRLEIRSNPTRKD